MNSVIDPSESFELTSSQEKALDVWKKLHDECPSFDGLKDYELWMLHRAHEMYRDGDLTGEEFAIVMDETVCW